MYPELNEVLELFHSGPNHFDDDVFEAMEVNEAGAVTNGQRKESGYFTVIVGLKNYTALPGSRI